MWPDLASPAWAGAAPVVLAAIVWTATGIAGRLPPDRFAWFFLLSLAVSGAVAAGGEAVTGHVPAAAAAGVSVLAAVAWPPSGAGTHQNYRLRRTR